VTPPASARLLRSRLGRVAAHVRERELDALLVTGQINVRYVTGFTGSSGLALVAGDRRENSSAASRGRSAASRGGAAAPGRGGAHRFITDFRYATQAGEQVVGAFRREIVSDNLLVGAAAALGRDGGRLGFDEKELTVAAYEQLAGLMGSRWELVASSEIIERLRAVKDAGEIDYIRAAAELADEAMSVVLEAGLAKRTERDVALELEQQMRRRGAEGPSFPSIVAAGPHGALPHARPREVKIPRNVLVTIDWGARHDGYCSDCTRTYATGERLGGQAREVYELVRSAQQQAVDAARAGLGARALDAVARGAIDAAGYGERFGHGLGHGVGLDIHEAPRLSRNAPDDPLEPGNVVTIEPGVYVPDALGARIEDLLVIKKSGNEVLTRLPKGLTVAA
jgi:Xaa-Pro aminopeptidase